MKINNKLNSKQIRLILDFIMIVLMLIENNYSFIGVKIHEILGLTIAFIVSIHCFINRKWFKNLFLKRQIKISLRHRVTMIINILLLISFTTLIISGILISNLITIITANQRFWSEIHHMMRNICAILLLGHIIINWKYIISYLKNKRKIVSGMGIVVIIATILFTLINKKINYNNKNNDKLSNVPSINGNGKTSNKNTFNSEETAIDKSGMLNLKFNFNPANTIASNQYAVWIEDNKGNVIKTLYVSDFTAKGGYKYRADSLKVWVNKSKLANMSDDEVDAISGATPKASQQSYTWDCTDENGNVVQDGQYNFYIEGTLYWSSSVLFSGSVTVGGGNMENIQITQKYTEDTKNNRDMISDVKVNYQSNK